VSVSPEILEASSRLAERLRSSASTITTIESCTGGLVGAAITALPGSSVYYPGGFVTYSNALKQDLVGVSNNTLDAYGAVSPLAAIEMARGGQSRMGTDYAIAITGIAGPDGGTELKPVGTVWICVAGPDKQLDCRRFVFPGDRGTVRHLSCLAALEMATQMLGGTPERLTHEYERTQA
jgi:nicotinamide-nucleotide amidase